MSHGREVLIGRNSKVWRAISANPAVAARFAAAIGHDALAEFEFLPSDRVWVFGYSRIPEENTRLLQILQRAGVGATVYVSTATTIVMRLTRCYEYPRVKQAAEQEARRLLDAKVLTLGVVVDAVTQMPPGRHAMTLLSRIEQFVLDPRWPEGESHVHLFEPVSVPFTRRWEEGLHRVYDALQWRCRRWPCVLRPLDLVLRMAGIRWYGYVNLSDRLWTMTTS